MTGLIYGFVVVAWLVIDLPDKAQYIPFATVEACEKAGVEVIKNQLGAKGGLRSALHINCLPTGARGR